MNDICNWLWAILFKYLDTVLYTNYYEENKTVVLLVATVSARRDGNTVKVAKMAGRLRWPAAKMAVFSNHQIFSSLSILN